MQLKALSSAVGKYKWAVKGKNGNYAVNGANLPLTGTMVIDVPNAKTGQCGEATFLAVSPAKPSWAVSQAPARPSDASSLNAKPESLRTEKRARSRKRPGPATVSGSPARRADQAM